MQETVTFVTPCKRFQVTVKKEYSLKHDLSDEFIKHMKNNGMTPYLHNENGPAIVHLLAQDMTEEERNLYFLNGKPIMGAEREKLKHNHTFNNTVEQIVNEEE